MKTKVLCDEKVYWPSYDKYSSRWMNFTLFWKIHSLRVFHRNARNWFAQSNPTIKKQTPNNILICKFEIRKAKRILLTHTQKNQKKKITINVCPNTLTKKKKKRILSAKQNFISIKGDYRIVYCQHLLCSFHFLCTKQINKQEKKLQFFAVEFMFRKKNVQSHLNVNLWITKYSQSQHLYQSYFEQIYLYFYEFKGARFELQNYIVYWYYYNYYYYWIRYNKKMKKSD